MPMFKAAEAGGPMSDAAFRKLKDTLRLDLIEAQQRVRAHAEFPMILVLGGRPRCGHHRHPQPAQHLDGPALDREYCS